MAHCPLSCTSPLPVEETVSFDQKLQQSGGLIKVYLWFEQTIGWGTWLWRELSGKLMEFGNYLLYIFYIFANKQLCLEIYTYLYFCEKHKTRIQVHLFPILSSDVRILKTKIWKSCVNIKRQISVKCCSSAHIICMNIALLQVMACCLRAIFVFWYNDKWVGCWEKGMIRKKS